MTEPITAEKLAEWRADHFRRSGKRGDWCNRCGHDWPCPSAALLDEVERLRADCAAHRSKANSERDAALASLAELREGAGKLTVRASFLAALSSNGARMLLTDINRLALAAATPGRGEKLLAVVEAAREAADTPSGSGLRVDAMNRLRDALADLDAGTAS